MVALEPNKRISAKEALLHPYFTDAKSSDNIYSNILWDSVWVSILINVSYLLTLYLRISYEVQSISKLLYLNLH
jgi:serine/threonine protein kinase